MIAKITAADENVAVDPLGGAHQMPRCNAAYKMLVRIMAFAGSFVYYACASTRRTIRRAAGKPLPATITVLCYHAVAAKHRKRFARQLDWVQSHARAVRPDAEFPIASGHHIAITFDDGYQSVVENAFPELKLRNIPCAMFVVSHQLGQSPWWSGTEGFDSDDKFLIPEQLLNVPSDLVTIGSHTMTHPDLTAVPQSQARREIWDSRDALQRCLHRPVQLMAFPHGRYNETLVGWCRDAGYERVFSSEPTSFNSSTYVVGRVMVDPSDWAFEFRLKASGAYEWLPVAFRIKRKMFGRDASTRRDADQLIRCEHPIFDKHV